MRSKQTDVERELGIEIDECIEPGCSMNEHIDTMLAYGSVSLGLNKVNKENETENRVKSEIEKKI